MKLRFKGDSLRLRVAPSEVTRLIGEGRIAETIHFGPQPEASLIYALETEPQATAIALRYAPQQATVVLPEALARSWAEGGEIGLYAQVPVSSGLLEIIVEKDFACLDRSDEENADTYPHPKQGAVC